MIIGIRAFLLIANHLQLPDIPPQFPSTQDILPSGNDLRVKTHLLTTPITDGVAQDLGIWPHIKQVRAALHAVLVALDNQVRHALAFSSFILSF